MENVNESPSEGLGTLLRSLLAQLEPAVEAAYVKKEPDMRSRFYPVMRALLACEEAGISDLARAASVSQPAMTQTVGQMIDCGLVASEPGRDRRERRISLSPKGQAAAERLRPVWSAVSAAAFALDEESGGALHLSLRSAIRSLEMRPFAARLAEEETQA